MAAAMSREDRSSRVESEFSVPRAHERRARRLLLVASFAGALAGGCAVPPPAVTPHGRGEAVPLEALRGKVVLINYWATWCQPCMDEIPALASVAAENQDRVVLLAVANNDGFDGRPRIERWLSKNPATFARYIVYGNDGLERAFPHHKLPTTYVLDVSGRVIEKVEGKMSLDRARAIVRTALERSPQ
jgi:thiol-disulfide isomerase/thioredoxin